MKKISKSAVWESAAKIKMVSALLTQINILRNRNRSHRFLEIGPGEERLPQYETLNIVAGHNVDYVFDAAKKLPFRDETFDQIYTSHILEHISWYQTVDAIKEWHRILKKGGILDVWVPNALLICKTLVDYELNGENNIHLDNWYKFNPEKDPCIWAAGRIFTYGDGTGSPDHPNWHRALFTPRYLQKVLQLAGFNEVHPLDRNEVRGHDHGWINLGMRARKT